MSKKENNNATTNNEIMTADRNMLANVNNGMSAVLGQFGFKSSMLEHDGNKYTITLKNVNGEGTIVKDVVLTDRVAKAFNDIATVEDLRKVDSIITAWNLKLIESSVKKMGYNTVGEFASLNYGIKANWANQLLNTAKVFLTEDENGVCYKYEWTKNVPFSNLSLILGRINGMDGETIEDKLSAFYDEYIVPHDDNATNVLNIAKQSELKKQLADLNEKDGKASKRKKTEKTETPTPTPLASLASVAEWVENYTEFILERKDEKSLAAYHNVLAELETLIMERDAIAKELENTPE